MQSRFTQTHPTHIKTPASLPCVSDRHSASVAAPRCAAHSSKQPPAQHHGDVRAVDNELSVPARQWIEQAHKLKDAFAAQRTLSGRSRRQQGYKQLEGGIRALNRARHDMRQHARSILQLPARLTAETRLQDVQAQAPGFVSEVQERMKAKAQRAWQDYERALETNPMRTKALTSCVGLTVADLIAQAAEGGAWDVARTGRMASFGLFWHGLSAHMWYQFLDKVVMPDNSSSTNAIVTKMVLDQAIWAPLNTALFYAYLAMANNHLSSLPDTLQAKLLPTILAGYALWPVAHLINFKYIPSNQRLLYINVVNLFWTVYLSGMANNATVVDPVQSQVHKFGLAIPVSHQPAAPPPVMQPPAPPSVVQV